ncbi:hypothetical protein BT63DRAFT_261764 [Microthyrium microscopicum]|uniref:Uncharacterized protein n=1 Tax=Microthyrium microscopicum TaxID=703497 RepID=A0A6A6UD12_9PEZI|nr:hypothetical protein BT63DRAFT_261764 [Microthyrium microscopicum]
MTSVPLSSRSSTMGGTAAYSNTIPTTTSSQTDILTTANRYTSQYPTPPAFPHKQTSAYQYPTTASSPTFKAVQPPSPALTASSIPEDSSVTYPIRPAHAHHFSIADSLFKLPPILTRASTVSSRSASPTRTHSRPSTPQSAISSTFSTASTASSVSVGARQHQHQRTHTRSGSKSFLEFFSPYASPGPDEYPAPEDFDMDHQSRSYTTRTRARQQSSASTTTNSTFAWLKSRVTSTSPSFVPASNNPKSPLDPYSNLDIPSVLLPNGPPDEPTPAFTSLLTTATALLSDLSSAYTSRTRALTESTAENAAQADELDEAETRARHLRMQLSDMSARLADTESALRGQLVEERQRREEAERELAQLRRERKRDSRTRISDSDSGFESDEESTLHSLNSSVESSPVIPTSQERKAVGPWGTNRAPVNGDVARENILLRQRVVELESAVDACLGLL